MSYLKNDTMTGKIEKRTIKSSIDFDYAVGGRFVYPIKKGENQFDIDEATAKELEAAISNQTKPAKKTAPENKAKKKAPENK